MSDSASVVVVFILLCSIPITVFCIVPCCFAWHDAKKLEKQKIRVAQQISPTAFSDFKRHNVSNCLKLELNRVFRGGNKSMKEFLDVATAEHADVLVACIRMIQVGTIEHVSAAVADVGAVRSTSPSRAHLPSASVDRGSASGDVLVAV